MSDVQLSRRRRSFAWARHDPRGPPACGKARIRRGPRSPRSSETAKAKASCGVAWRLYKRASTASPRPQAGMTALLLLTQRLHVQSAPDRVRGHPHRARRRPRRLRRLPRSRPELLRCDIFSLGMVSIVDGNEKDDASVLLSDCSTCYTRRKSCELVLVATQDGSRGTLDTPNDTL